MHSAGFHGRMLSSHLCSGNRGPAWWSGESSRRVPDLPSCGINHGKGLCYGHIAIEQQCQAQNSLCCTGPVLVIAVGISPAALL